MAKKKTGSKLETKTQDDIKTEVYRIFDEPAIREELKRFIHSRWVNNFVNRLEPNKLVINTNWFEDLNKIDGFVPEAKDFPQFREEWVAFIISNSKRVETLCQKYEFLKNSLQKLAEERLTDFNIVNFCLYERSVSQCFQLLGKKILVHAKNAHKSHKSNEQLHWLHWLLTLGEFLRTAEIHNVSQFTALINSLSPYQDTRILFSRLPESMLESEFSDLVDIPISRRVGGVNLWFSKINPACAALEEASNDTMRREGFVCTLLKDRIDTYTDETNRRLESIEDKNQKWGQYIREHLPEIRTYRYQNLEYTSLCYLAIASLESIIRTYLIATGHHQLSEYMSSNRRFPDVNEGHIAKLPLSDTCSEKIKFLRTSGLRSKLAHAALNELFTDGINSVQDIIGAFNSKAPMISPKHRLFSPHNIYQNVLEVLQNVGGELRISSLVPSYYAMDDWARTVWSLDPPWQFGHSLPDDWLGAGNHQIYEDWKSILLCFISTTSVSWQNMVQTGLLARLRPHQQRETYPMLSNLLMVFEVMMRQASILEGKPGIVFKGEGKNLRPEYLLLDEKGLMNTENTTWMLEDVPTSERAIAERVLWQTIRVRNYWIHGIIPDLSPNEIDGVARLLQKSLSLVALASIRNIIRREAFLKYKSRLESGISGSAEDDWNSAHELVASWFMISPSLRL